MELSGQSLGRYQVLEQLGEGGMATVYKAYDTRLDRNVAVKVIRTEQFAPVVLDRVLKRFETEAKALARLSHPNIVKVLDYGEYKTAPYLVLEYLPGGTLKHRLHKRLPWQEAARLVLPVAEALQYAHAQGIIHRDIKPSNILMTNSAQPMLSDFGIAKLLDEAETQSVTGTGMGIGTFEYMAPEQLQGGRVDGRADIYGLGVVLYELITGRRPYEADTPPAIIWKQASEPLPRPGRFVANLPESVEHVLLRALAKTPQDRFQDMGAFAAGLRNVLSGAPSRVRGAAAGSKPGDTMHAAGGLFGGLPSWVIFGGLIVLLGLGIGLGALLFRPGVSAAPAAPAPTLAPTEPAIAVPALTASPLPSSTLAPSSTPAASETPASVTVKSNFVKMREGPDTRFPPSKDLPPGTTVELLGAYHSWYLVRLESGQIGWLYIDWLSVPPGLDLRDVVPVGISTLPAACKKYCK